MKIITKEKAYIQKKDIANLMSTMEAFSLSCPMSVFNQFFSEVFICTQDNMYDFVEITDKASIDFFKKLDYILDYDEVKDLTEEEIIKLGQSINDEINILIKKFDSMSIQEKNKEFNRMKKQSKIKEYKMYDIRDFLWLKQGHLNFKLPSDIEYSKEYNNSKKKNKGIRKLVRTLFDNNKRNRRKK